jgi:hypothetical protein
VTLFLKGGSYADLYRARLYNGKILQNATLPVLLTFGRAYKRSRNKNICTAFPAFMQFGLEFGEQNNLPTSQVGALEFCTGFTYSTADLNFLKPVASYALT